MEEKLINKETLPLINNNDLYNNFAQTVNSKIVLRSLTKEYQNLIK
jgi:hypothetical protein